MKILLTNDDGYDAPNIVALYKKLSKKHDVWIVAPEKNCSGMSAAISFLKEIEVRKVADKIFAVDFQSYNYIPNRDYRISKWEKFKNLNFNMLKDLAKGKWTNPARHPLRKNYESNF